MNQHTWVTEPHQPGAWPTTTTKRRGHTFRASWSDTLDLMNRELASVGAKGLVVLQLDIVSGRIRRDGLPEARVTTGFPGVAISFECDHGPLTYRVDTFETQWSGQLLSWQANFRAIALTLEALRAVNRYGAAESRQQYIGWLALPSGAFGNESEANQWLWRTAQRFGIRTEGVPGAVVVKQLLRALHPDTSKLPEPERSELWTKLEATRKLLEL